MNKYLALARNAIVVILGTLTAFLLSRYRSEIPFAITGDVASGFPTFTLPPFSTTVNGTEVPLKGMIKELGGSLVTIPFVAILEIFAIAKAFGERILFNYQRKSFNNLFFFQQRESPWMRVRK